MRNRLMGFLVVLLLGVSGCVERGGSFQFSGPVDPPLTLSRESVTKIRLTEYDIAGYSSVDQAMWTEGIRAGMRDVFNEYLQLEPVFRFTEGSGGCADTGGVQRIGTVTFTPDPVTGDYVQRFRAAARFAPGKECAGRILSLEEDRFLAGTGDRFTAVVYGSLPAEGDGYFLVAENLEEVGAGVLQVIGSGRIIRSLGPAGYGSGSKVEPAGTLCQGELWETAREVEQGDHIFLLSTSVEALPEFATEEQGPEPAKNHQEVVVEPTMEPVYQEPGESK